MDYYQQGRPQGSAGQSTHQYVQYPAQVENSDRGGLFYYFSIVIRVDLHKCFTSNRLGIKHNKQLINNTIQCNRDQLTPLSITERSTISQQCLVTVRVVIRGVVHEVLLETLVRRQFKLHNLLGSV
uniref:Uncharacterized protein n=1 Tax=Heterorhabditis bacteriophora TaxID=37862 RepID=A0A1I7WR65_HETBA